MIRTFVVTLLAQAPAPGAPGGWVERLSTAVGLGSPTPGGVEVVLAALLAFGLCCLVSAVYRATRRGRGCRQDFIHAMLILGVVVCVFVMVIQSGDGDRALATGFGMFAAFSMIRFRTAVSEPRDIGFLFFAMTAGLAVGARQYMLACVGTAAVSGIILGFTKADLFASSSCAHALQVWIAGGLDPDRTFHDVFTRLLARHALRAVETGKKGDRTTLLYDVVLARPEDAAALVRELARIEGVGRVRLRRTAP